MIYTYTTLKCDFQDIDNFLYFNKNLHGLSELRKLSSLSGYANEFDVCLGLSLLGVSFEKRYQFLTNRFFLDALNIKLMPSNDCFEKYMYFLKNNLDPNNKLTAPENYFKKEAAKIILDKYKNLSNYFGDAFILPKIQPKDYDFLDKNGYLVIPDAVPNDFCDLVNKRINELAESERNSDKGGYIYGLGNSQRIYHLLGKDKLFWKAISHPLILELMDHFFQRDTLHDRYYLTSYHANILNPGAEPQILHVDAAVPEPLPPWIIRANSNILLQDYTLENGATEVVAGSHLLNRKPTKQDMLDFPLKKLVGKKGSLIVWHGHLWHRSGENKSTLPRTALLGTFCASHFREMCLEENPYLNYDQLTIESIPSDIKNLMGWYHGAKKYT